MERLRLELADALPRQPELLADRLQRGGLAVEAEPELDDPALPLRQVGDRPLGALAANRVDGLLGGVERRLVGEQVAELGVAVRAEALVERDRVDRVEGLDDMLDLEAGRIGELLARRLASELCLQLGRRAVQLDPPLLDVHRDPDRLGLVRDRALAGLAGPPRRVRRELVALAPVELLGGAVQADDALLDEVQQRDVMTLVALRDRDDEAEIRVDHALLRGSVAALDALCEVHLVGGRQQLVAAGGVHEELQRVERAGGSGSVAGGGGLGAQDDIALFERGAQRRDVLLGELVLVGEGLELLLLDETALGGLLDKALGRRQVMQMNRVAQLNPFHSWWGHLRRRPPRHPGRGFVPAETGYLGLIYRTASLGSPFPNIAFLRFPNFHLPCIYALFSYSASPVDWFSRRRSSAGRALHS